jgi:hypothetical protein
MSIYWAEMYILTIKKKTEALVVASKENGLEVNADKTKFMIMFQIRMQDKVKI